MLDPPVICPFLIASLFFLYSTIEMLAVRELLSQKIFETPRSHFHPSPRVKGLEICCERKGRLILREGREGIFINDEMLQNSNVKGKEKHDFFMIQGK